MRVKVVLACYLREFCLEVALNSNNHLIYGPENFQAVLRQNLDSCSWYKKVPCAGNEEVCFLDVEALAAP